MIKSIVIKDGSKSQIIDDFDAITTKFVLKNSKAVVCNSTQIEINFLEEIVAFRNHDFTWVQTDDFTIATDFSPKIIKLKNGCYLQPNINIGIWQVSKNNPYQLVWLFYPEYSNPITEYSGINNIKKISSAHPKINLSEDLALLFSKTGGLELSRSKIPFAAIACFTDHCDYDTPENLKIQRTFFKSLDLKVTKGFFLNHFSKRSDNASWQNDHEELRLWQKDGHELCYHSLSQSIKLDDESFSDFRNFTPPLDAIPVWIDHGFQPYNFSLYKNNNFSDQDFETILNRNMIKVLWNYIDCGTASNGILNQLNPKQFTLQTYLNSIQAASFKTKIIKLVKAIIFHFDNDKNRVRNYIDALSAARKLVNSKNPIYLMRFTKSILPVVGVLLKTFLRWDINKNKSFKAAKFSPLFFDHQINATTFTVFQTIEMVDFINGLSKNNIDLLVREQGVFIAHTYFSVDMKHHNGKLFKESNRLDEQVVQNFTYLSEKINKAQIWNPTLSELLLFYTDYKSVVFDITDEGAIFIKNTTTIPTRAVL